MLILNTKEKLLKGPCFTDLRKKCIYILNKVHIHERLARHCRWSVPIIQALGRWRRIDVASWRSGGPHTQTNQSLCVCPFLFVCLVMVALGLNSGTRHAKQGESPLPCPGISIFYHKILAFKLHRILSGLPLSLLQTQDTTRPTYQQRNIYCPNQVNVRVANWLVSFKNICLIADSRYGCSILSKLDVCLVSEFPKQTNKTLFKHRYHTNKQDLSLSSVLKLHFFFKITFLIKWIFT